MNPYTSFSMFRNQERIANQHREEIIYALRILEQAISGEIKKFIDAKVKAELKEKYSSSRFLTYDNKQIEKQRIIELKEKIMSQRTIQKWLTVLETNGLVSKSKYNVYTLTKVGRSLKIFGESYGKLLFESLISIPMKGSDKEKLTECIKCLGTYILFMFVQVKRPNYQIKETKEMYSLHRDILKINDLQWVNELFSPLILFQWFNNIFYSNDKGAMTQTKIVNRSEELSNILLSQFPEYFRNLSTSNYEYFKTVFPNLYEKEIEKLRMEMGT